MGRLILRTAIANLRSRPLQTGLVALILTAASATLALAVSLRAGAADPYEQIARATNAADVHVLARPGRCVGAPGLGPDRGGPRLRRRLRGRPGQRAQQARQPRPGARGRRCRAAAHRPAEGDRRALAVEGARRGRARPDLRAQRRLSPRRAPRAVVRGGPTPDRRGPRGRPRRRRVVGQRGDAAGHRTVAPRSARCSSCSSPTAMPAGRSSTACAGATSPTSSTRGTGARTART